MKHELNDIPGLLLRDLGLCPVVPEEEIGLFMKTSRGSIHSRQAGGVSLDDGLHPRERQVLELRSNGLNDEMVAEALHLALATVQHYEKTARYRLRAKNILHACCIAIRKGLIN